MGSIPLPNCRMALAGRMVVAHRVGSAVIAVVVAMAAAGPW